MKRRPVAGGGHAIRVTPARLPGWLERFVTAHGPATTAVDTVMVAGVLGEVEVPAVTVTCGDGASARIAVPYEPWSSGDDPLASLVAHVRRERTVGIVLARLGAHSVGIARAGKVVDSRTDRHLVHGRNAAGGWSQQRFARRRAGQARVALAAATEDVVAKLVGVELDAVVFGGDRTAARTILEDNRLSTLRPLVQPWLLDVPEPRRVVLDGAAVAVTEVEIVIQHPA